MGERALGYLTNNREDPVLKELCDHPVLTRDQERQLFLDMEAGDPWAREIIARNNFRLVLSIAKGFTQSGVPLRDLFSAGCVELATSIRDFDVHRGNRLVTLAFPRIKTGITRWIDRRKDQDISLGVVDNERVRKIKAAYQEVMVEAGEEPEVETIAQRTGIESERVRQLLEESQAFGVFSLDSPRQPGSSRAFYNYIPDEGSPDPAEIMERRDFFDTIRRILGDSQLNQIIVLYYYCNYSDEEISVSLKTAGTRSRIQQLRSKALIILGESGLMDRQLWA